MKITIRFGKRDRVKFVKTCDRIYGLCRELGKAPPRITVEKLPGKKKIGTIEY